MTYDPDIAERLRELLAGEDNLTEQKMFGGLAFLINRNMAVAASAEGGLLVHVDPADAGGWIDGHRVTPMVMRGREMRGWLHVHTDADGPELEQWVSRGAAYARSLPPKSS